MKMHSFILAACLFIGATTAEATIFNRGGEGGGGSSIYDADTKLPSDRYAVYPVILFGGAMVHANNVCLEADGVTLNGGQTRICQGRNSGNDCPLVELRTSINEKKEVCPAGSSYQGKCANPQVVDAQIPLQFDVDVVKLSTYHSPDYANPVGSFHYEIPSCP